MNTDPLIPELREIVRKIPPLPFHIKPLIPLSRFIYNHFVKSPLAKGVTVSNERFGTRSMRVWKPETGGTDAGVLWCFGGGHIAGRPEHLDRLASQIVLTTGATVFAPHYRLAPKHPFPADLDDCFACWKHLIAEANRFGVSADRLAVGGHSAGGGLAAALSQRIYDDGGPQPKAQILFYPMLDDRTAVDRSKDSLETFIWRNKTNKVAWSVYLHPHILGAGALPDYAAPARREDVSGLPPAWIGYGDIDLFAEEDKIYATRLVEAGVEVEERRVAGVPHAFEALSPNIEVSKQFVVSAIEFLGSKLDK